jgi:hypothetical protein
MTDLYLKFADEAEAKSILYRIEGVFGASVIITIINTL